MKKNVLQKPVVLFVTGVLLVCLSGSVRTLLADVHAIIPEQTLSSLQENTYRYRYVDWEHVRAQLQRALDYTPDNPELLHLLGRAYERQYVLSLYPDDGARVARQKAAELYRKASAIRPAWPHDRIDILLVDYLLQGYNPDIYEQMKISISLGPWEPWVNQVVTEIGLQQWEELGEEARELIGLHAQRAVLDREDQDRMLYLLRIYEKLELVCPEVVEEHVVQYCNRYLDS